MFSNQINQNISLKLAFNPLYLFSITTKCNNCRLKNKWLLVRPKQQEYTNINIYNLVPSTPLVAYVPHTTLDGFSSDVIISTWTWWFTRIFRSPLKCLSTQKIKLVIKGLPLTFVYLLQFVIDCMGMFFSKQTKMKSIQKIMMTKNVNILMWI